MNSQIKWLGPLDQNGGTWAGSIGSRLSPGESDKYEQLVDQSFEPTAKQAAMRCIDGRVGDTHPALGPQVAGGGPGFSIAFHIADSHGSNVIDDFKNLFDRHHGTNDHFAIGGHIDDHAKPPFSGCGAIDKMPQILQAMVSQANLNALEQYSQAIIGGVFDAKVFKRSLDLMLSINPEQYFKEHGHSYRQDLLDEIKKRSVKKTIEELEGPHKEAFVVINMLPNTTLDKEDFVARTKNEVQAFNYDYWYTEFLSHELFPNDKLKQSLFISANVVYNLATALVLTDGSQDLGVRQ